MSIGELVNKEIIAGDAFSSYRSESYCRSLSEFGVPFPLRHAGGWMLKRPVKDSDNFDAAGCYPLFCCNDWSALKNDIDELTNSDLLSVCLVSDPLANIQFDTLKTIFSDLCVPFKMHFLVDLRKAPESFVSRHHQRYARKASRELIIELEPNPELLINDWAQLYDNLIKRHCIKGIAKFSYHSFEILLNMPSLSMFSARNQNGDLLGILLCLAENNSVYYHLAAYNNEGYKAKASFGLFWKAISHFSSLGYQWFCLGAGAGLSKNLNDGLTKFKQGWANEHRQVFLCGKILNKNIYADTVNSVVGANRSNFFPAYRYQEH